MPDFLNFVSLPALPCLLQNSFFHWPASRQGAMVALTAAMGLRNLAGQNSFSSSMIMINLVAPAHAMGAVNGAPRCLTRWLRWLEGCCITCCSSLLYLLRTGTEPLLGIMLLHHHPECMACICFVMHIDDDL